MKEVLGFVAINSGFNNIKPFYFTNEINSESQGSFNPRFVDSCGFCMNLLIFQGDKESIMH